MSLQIDKSKRSPNFSAGRPLGAPNMIVIHHWGADGQRFENVVSWLCRHNGNSSAHYVAAGGRVAEIVAPENRAWHAGAKGNPRGIGIECRPECSAADFETVAQLVAYLRKRYGALPLAKHNDFMSTDCPGRWARRLAELSARSDAINAAGAPVRPSDGARLAVDGVAGRATVSALQRRLGTPVDGVISSQSLANRVYLPAFTVVEYVTRPRGSACVSALQKFLNAQAAAGLAVDGHAGALTVSALQKFLNAQAAAGLAVDGVAGKLTVSALQTWLNK